MLFSVRWGTPADQSGAFARPGPVVDVDIETRGGDYKKAYNEALGQIEYAEELGFDNVWLAEHHGSKYGSMPSPQVFAAAVAQATERIRIGIAVSVLPFDNPVRVAEDYAMVDVLSNGRLDL